MAIPHLPLELLDYIVDLLQDIPDALKTCCLVSKSWVPRARRHLFSRIALLTAQSLRAWKTTFQDPSTSPAYYTRSLLIQYPRVVTVADAEEGGWISTFSRVVHLEMEIDGTGVYEPGTFLIPFHGFPHALKSLRVSFAGLPSSHVSDLIHSFPHLQDLAVTPYDVYDSGSSFHKRRVAISPSNALAFTGSLKISLSMGVSDPIASRLLSLPNGLFFRELLLKLDRKEDMVLAMELVRRCSSTLETLGVGRELTDVPSSTVDLSNAIKLKEVIFVFQNVPGWVSAMLRTITSNNRNLQQISLHTSGIHYSVSPIYFAIFNGENAWQGWLELDRILARLRESHSTQLKISYGVISSWDDVQTARSCMEALLPEVTRGMVELVERRREW